MSNGRKDQHMSFLAEPLAAANQDKERSPRTGPADARSNPLTEREFFKFVRARIASKPQPPQPRVYARRKATPPVNDGSDGRLRTVVELNRFAGCARQVCCLW